MVPLYLQICWEEMYWFFISPFTSIYFLPYCTFIFLIVSVLVSWGYCNKLPRYWCLKTRETYSLTVLEAINLKPKCWQGFTPLDWVITPSFLLSFPPSLLSPFFLSCGHWWKLCSYSRAILLDQPESLHGRQLFWRVAYTFNRFCINEK